MAILGMDGKEIDITKGDAVVLSKFFRKSDQKLDGFMAEFRELTDEDKTQMAAGIRDGSLNY